MVRLEVNRLLDGSRLEGKVLGGFWRVSDSFHLVVEVVDFVEFFEEV